LPTTKLSPAQLVLWTKSKRRKCKYFSQAQLLRNSLIINTLQNLLFCIPKAAVLHGKSVGFALQNSRFRSVKSKLPFFYEIILTKSELILAFSSTFKTIGQANILLTLIII